LTYKMWPRLFFCFSIYLCGDLYQYFVVSEPDFFYLEKELLNVNWRLLETQTADRNSMNFLLSVKW
jgi:hypothetical protein